MSEYFHKCQMSDHEHRVGSYNDFACDNCGQRYEYEEGHRIVLTSQQVNLLRYNFGQPLSDSKEVGEEIEKLRREVETLQLLLEQKAVVIDGGSHTVEGPVGYLVVHSGTVHMGTLVCTTFENGKAYDERLSAQH